MADHVHDQLFTAGVEVPQLTDPGPIGMSTPSGDSTYISGTPYAGDQD